MTATFKSIESNRVVPLYSFRFLVNQLLFFFADGFSPPRVNEMQERLEKASNKLEDLRQQYDELKVSLKRKTQEIRLLKDRVRLLDTPTEQD